MPCPDRVALVLIVAAVLAHLGHSTVGDTTQPTRDPMLVVWDALVALDDQDTDDDLASPVISALSELSGHPDDPSTKELTKQARDALPKEDADLEAAREALMALLIHAISSRFPNESFADAHEAMQRLSSYVFAFGDGKQRLKELEVEEISTDNMECSVCLENNDVPRRLDQLCPDDDFEPGTDGDKAVRLQCEHTFHMRCIFGWVNKSGRDTTCPICRVPVFITAEESASSSTPDDVPVEMSSSPTTASIDIIPGDTSSLYETASTDDIAGASSAFPATFAGKDFS